jgi:hypothetical protein
MSLFFITKYYNFDDDFVYRLKNNHNRDGDFRNYEEIFKCFSLRKGKKAHEFLLYPKFPYRLNIVLVCSQKNTWIAHFSHKELLTLSCLFLCFLVPEFFLDSYNVNAYILIICIIGLWIQQFVNVFLLDKKFSSWTI